MSKIIVTKAKDRDGYYAMVNDPGKGFSIKMSFWWEYVNQIHISQDTKELARQSVFTMIMEDQLRIVEDELYNE